MLSLQDSILNLTKILKTVKYIKSTNCQVVLDDLLKDLEKDLKSEIDKLTEILITEQRSVD